MKVAGSSIYFVHDTEEKESWTEHFYIYVVYKIISFIRTPAKERCDGFKDGDIILTCVKRAWVSAHDVLTLKDYNWKGRKVKVEEEKMRENIVSVR